MKTGVLFDFSWSSSEICEVAQSFSTADDADLVGKQDGVYNDVREMLSGMCNKESCFLRKVCQCNAQSVCRKYKGMGKGRADGCQKGGVDVSERLLW